MFISVATSKEDLDNYTWFVYTGSTPITIKAQPGMVLNKRQKSITLTKGTLFGGRLNRVGNIYFRVEYSPDSKGVLRNTLHFRFVLPASHAGIYAKMKKYANVYDGPTPEYQEIDEGFERRRRQLNTVHAPNRITSDHFFRDAYPDETQFINLDNYQWRKINADAHRIPVLARRTGKFKYNIGPGHIIGVRWQKPSTGGYIINDTVDDKSMLRVNVSAELYDDIIRNSKVLLTSQQKSGIMLATTGEMDAPENVNNIISPKTTRRVRKAELEEQEAPEDKVITRYDIDPDVADMDKTRRRKSRKSIKSLVEQLFKVDDLDTLASIEDEDEDDSFDFEPDETEVEETEVEETEVEETEVEEPDDEEPDDEEPEGEELDDEELDDEELDDEEFVDPASSTGDKEIDSAIEESDLYNKKEPDEEDPGEQPVLELLEPGVIIQDINTDKQYGIIDVQPYEGASGQLDTLTRLLLHDLEGEPTELYRLNVKNNMTINRFSEKVTITDEKMSENEVILIYNGLEYATIKPLRLGT